MANSGFKLCGRSIGYREWKGRNTLTVFLQCKTTQSLGSACFGCYVRAGWTLWTGISIGAVIDMITDPVRYITSINISPFLSLSHGPLTKWYTGFIWISHCWFDIISGLLLSVVCVNNNEIFWNTEGMKGAVSVEFGIKYLLFGWREGTHPDTICPFNTWHLNGIFLFSFSSRNSWDATRVKQFFGPVSNSILDHCNEKKHWGSKIVTQYTVNI